MTEQYQESPTPIRMPLSLLAWLKDKAEENRRSLTKEIQWRLERSRDMEMEVCQ